ncbi:MAG: ketopantoate reductase family protein [Bacteroidota bacterium]
MEQPRLRNKKILVIGAGAVGSVTASLLKLNGYDVTIVTKYPDVAEKVSTTGFQLTGYRGSHTVLVPAISNTDQCQETADYICVATKANDMLEAIANMIPKLKPDGRIISMQNGIVEETLASIVGDKRVVGCVVGWGATMHERGVVEMTSGGEFVIGYLKQAADEQLRDLAEILGAIVPVEISDNILSNLYSKLIINSCVTTLGAISGQYLGTMLKSRTARKIFIRIIREAMAVARSMQLEVKPYANKLDYYSFLRGSELKRHLIIRVFGMKYKKLKSSSLQSLERGKPTEINYFNGYIARKGKEHRTDAPMNQLLTNIVREIEEGKRKISPENFRDPEILKLL